MDPTHIPQHSRQPIPRLIRYPLDQSDHQLGVIRDGRSRARQRRSQDRRIENRLTVSLDDREVGFRQSLWGVTRGVQHGDLGREDERD
jgi:hypothetical protein